MWYRFVAQRCQISTSECHNPERGCRSKSSHELIALQPRADSTGIWESAGWSMYKLSVLLGVSCRWISGKKSPNAHQTMISFSLLWQRQTSISNCHFQKFTWIQLYKWHVQTFGFIVGWSWGYCLPPQGEECIQTWRDNIWSDKTDDKSWQRVWIMWTIWYVCSLSRQ